MRGEEDGRKKKVFPGVKKWIGKHCTKLVRSKWKSYKIASKVSISSSAATSLRSILLKFRFNIFFQKNSEKLVLIFFAKFTDWSSKDYLRFFCRKEDNFKLFVKLWQWEPTNQLISNMDFKLSEFDHWLQSDSDSNDDMVSMIMISIYIRSIVN